MYPIPFKLSWAYDLFELLGCGESYTVQVLGVRQKKPWKLPLFHLDTPLQVQFGEKHHKEGKPWDNNGKRKKLAIQET